MHTRFFRTLQIRSDQLLVAHPQGPFGLSRNKPSARMHGCVLCGILLGSIDACPQIRGDAGDANIEYVILSFT
jgi:hypothetical protein